MGWTVNVALLVASMAVLVAVRPWKPGVATRPSFIATAMLSGCICLTIPAVYAAIDTFIGGSNYANLLLHLCLNLAFYFIGLALADSHLAPRAYRAISGPIGISVWLLVAGCMTVAFAMSDLQGSGAGLRKVADGQLSIAVYEFLIRVYPAFVATCILVPLAVSVLNRRRSITLRLFSTCMAITFALSLVTTVGFALPIFGIKALTSSVDALTWGAVGLFLGGAALVPLDRFLGQRRQKR